MKNLEVYIEKFFNLFSLKKDLDGAIFELFKFEESISYGAISSSASREDEIEKNIAKVESEILKNFLLDTFKSKKTDIFEPGNFHDFSIAIKQISEDYDIVSMKTAIELKKEDLSALIKKFFPVNKRVLFELEVDPSIIGGAIIKRNNYILDYSTKTKLANLTSEWKKSIRQTKES